MLVITLKRDANLRKVPVLSLLRVHTASFSCFNLMLNGGMEKVKRYRPKTDPAI